MESVFYTTDFLLKYKASTVSLDWFSAAHLNKTIIINFTSHHSKIIIVIYKIMIEDMHSKSLRNIYS